MHLVYRTAGTSSRIWEKVVAVFFPQDTSSMYVRVFIFALKPPYSHSGRWSSVCGLFLRFIFSASNGDSLTSICTVSSIVSYWSYHLLAGIAFFAYCPFWMSFGLDYGGVPHTTGPIIKLAFLSMC